MDLHGFLHEDVPEAVHRFINGHWASGWRLHIITGQSDRMRSIVRSVVMMYDVEIEPDPWNSGEIVVMT